MPKKNTLFSYFAKSPRASKVSDDSDSKSGDILSPKQPNNDPDKQTILQNGTPKGKSTPVKGDEESDTPFQPGDLVWAKLEGYPWWASIVCNHPTNDKHVRKKGKHLELHVMFFDEVKSRGWVKFKNVNAYTGSDSKEFARGGKFYSSDPDAYKGAKEADTAMEMSLRDRVELLLVEMLPSESESEEENHEMMDLDGDIFDAEEGSDLDNSKENHEDGENGKEKKTPKKTPQKSPRKTPKKSTRSSARPQAKRRKIVVESGDEFDSEDEYKPKGEESSEDESSGVDEDDVSDIETESEAGSPTKDSRKRKKQRETRTPKPSFKGRNKFVRVPRVTGISQDEASDSEEHDPPKSKAKAALARFAEDEKVSPTATPSRSPKDKEEDKATPSRPAGESGFTPTVGTKTKSKLASFSAPDRPDSPAGGPDEARSWPHLTLEFLKPEKIRDADRRPRDHPEYNPRTLFVPDSFLEKQTPAMRQWWEIKAKHYDTVLFFKMGKFYEFFHMDSVTGVNELGLIFMKGEHAHSGFPEIAYGRYADTLIQKGYRVARIEQTETPDTMQERCKKMLRATKFDKVVKREVCRVQSKGTKVCSFIDGDTSEANNSYLLAICEQDTVEASGGGGRTYGVCFVDTSIGKFHLGQFDDDRHCSRLRTLISHYPPAQVLYERGKISEKTHTIINTNLASALQDSLRSATEFWDASKTLKFLSESIYFVDENNTSAGAQWPEALKLLISPDDPLHQTAADGKELAVRSLGAITWFLQDCLLDEELLSMRNFKEYIPVDARISLNAKDKIADFAAGRNRMVLDGVTLFNLEILVNSSTGTAEGSLLERLDQCHTPFGKRLLKQWTCAPLCNPTAINDRLNAVEDLMANPEAASEAADIMKKLPDLERLLSKIHTLGCANRSKTHPESRAVFFEGDTYSKRKIEDFLAAVAGFRSAVKVTEKFKNVCSAFKSKLLQQTVTVEEDQEDCVGKFPNLDDELAFFDNAFDHNKAKQAGVIKPCKGVDPEYDDAIADIKETTRELDEYLEQQKKRLGCRTMTYWGTAKNRFQMEIPEQVAKKVPDEYELMSQKKGAKRYRTRIIEKLLARLTDCEDRRDVALKDTMRRIFFAFDKNYKSWDRAVQCLSVLDVLMCMAQFSRCGDGEMCRPEIIPPSEEAEPFIEIREARHPCISRTFSGGDFIPNDTIVGIVDENDMETDAEDHSHSRVVLVTGPNMGGKSTLMRQVGVVTVLAQLGCYVPAEKCSLTPVDRVFTRLGASDRIMAGESTFFVELSETSSILQHATKHSLVLLDELGRGTATYDGTAIACAVVQELSQNVKCRTLFSTHYHSLVEEFSHDPNVRLGHMACMVENENDEDPSQETITFLYKFVKGACPKSYGFNAARLADLPEQVIQTAIEKAKLLESTVESTRYFRELCRLDASNGSKLKSLHHALVS